MSQPITSRYDFVYLFDCKDGNPNGDPDAANSPRVDPQDMHGLVSDVCLKRKVRNFVQIAKPDTEGYDIFVQQGTALNDHIQRVHDDLGHKLNAKTGATRAQVVPARAKMCARYYDVRTFGAVMSTGVNAGQVRGPVQVSFSRSIDPVLPLDVSITRMAVAEAKDAESPNQTMGRKNLIPYGLYRCHGFISAHLAKDTLFTAADLELFWQALAMMFDHDRSASRGTMAPQALLVFEHATPLGNAPAHKLFERIKIAAKPGVTVARDFSDYDLTFDGKPIDATKPDAPIAATENVKLHRML
jgi:CRISPR-associated protein Csd2